MNQHTTKWKYTSPKEIEASDVSSGLLVQTHGHHIGTCIECGQKIGGTAARKDRKVSKSNRRSAWSHLQAHENVDSVLNAPMELVGRIIKKRVINEIWIFSAYGDMPEEIASRVSNEYNRRDTLRAVPWIVVLKNSKGWAKWFSRYTFREQAYAVGLEMLNEAFIEGHEIEVASQIDMDTIQIPMGAVENYLTTLVNEAKDTDKPEDLVALQTRLKKARGMLELLEAAQELVQSKLVGIDIPDSRYTEYEYNPKERKS